MTKEKEQFTKKEQTNGAQSALMVKLPDGRKLSYAEFGDPDGKPIIYFHGYPGSRLQGGFLDEDAARLGARIISPDRPGMGKSDPMPNRTVLDWSADVASLADALGLTRFAVLGASGGGPYTAVSAWSMPERVTKAGFMAAISPTNFSGALDGMSFQGKMLLRLGRFAPWSVSIFLRGMARMILNQPEPKIIETMKKSMPEVDFNTVESGNHWSSLISDTKEAFRQGIHGVVQDGKLYSKPWGFPLGEIQVPTFLWQGEEDQNVPPVMGRYLADAIPNCEATFLPEVGHISLIFGQGERVLETMLT